MDTVKVSQLIKKLEGFEPQLEAERDRLNLALGQLRATIRRLKAQLELTEILEASGEKFPVPGAERAIFDVLGYLVALTQEMLPPAQTPVAQTEPAVKKPRVRKEKSPMPAETLPPPPKDEGKTGKTGKPYGAYPIAISILKAAFSGEDVLALEAALEKKYGKNWRQQDIGGFSTGGKRTTRKMGEDMGLPNSILKGYLIGAYQNLLRIERGDPPGPTAKLLDLYRLITQDNSLEVLKNTLISWGVDLS